MLDYLVEKKNYLILFFTISYFAAFTVNAAIQANFEFLYYTVLMVIVIFIIIFVNKRLHLAFFILLNLSLIGFLHLSGGIFYLQGVRLYDIYFISGIIRYDNIIHTYSTFIATITLYSLLADVIHTKVRKKYFVFASILILMAIGLGTINEIVELIAVVLFGVTEEVGGYFNNSLDLVFNMIGAVLATILIYFYIERPKFIEKLNVKTREDN